MKPGLYLVSTPIGNERDITLRALDCLREADAIFCEDSRVTGQLLKHHAIETSVFTYHEHNAEEVRPEIIRKIKEGKSIVLVSDAGTPTISDPGFKLVREVVKQGFNVSALPGPCAAITALSLSGLPTDRFYFAGFLPSKSSSRKSTLESIKNISATMIFYENKNRLQETLQDILEVWGDGPCSVLRELTKVHEEVYRHSISNLVSLVQAKPPKGEIVVVVDRTGVQKFREDLVEPLIKKYLNKYPLKTVAQMVSEETGVSKNVIYDRALKVKEGKS